jgi:acetylornithine aminotransferase
VVARRKHGTTFGGNPLAMRAALEVIAVMEDDGLCANAAAMGTRIKQGFEKAFVGNLSAGKGVLEIRAHGLMMGVVLNRPCAELVKKGLEHGILFNVTADTVLRLLPPLILTADQADEIVAKVSSIVNAFLASEVKP